jgi:DNA-binding MarR family transcriptional regulator
MDQSLASVDSVAVATSFGADEPGFDLGKFLPFRISVLANRLSRRLARASLKQFQLNAPEWRIIAVLGHFGTMPNHRVIELTSLDPVRMSRAVSGLLQKGYITRLESPEDRRRATLDLTQAGAGVYGAMIPVALEAEAGVLAAASDEERQKLEQILNKLELAAQTGGNGADGGEV